MMFFEFPTRHCDLAIFIEMIEEAITKLGRVFNFNFQIFNYRKDRKSPKDDILALHPQTIPYMDRKSFLQTVKEILTEFAKNINVYSSTASESMSLREYAEGLVLKSMVHTAAETKKGSQAPNYMLASSESESDNGSNPNEIIYHKKVIKDYMGSQEKKGPFLKALTQAIGQKHVSGTRKYAEVYAESAKIYFERSRTSDKVDKMLEYSQRLNNFELRLVCGKNTCLA